MVVRPSNTESLLKPLSLRSTLTKMTVLVAVLAMTVVAALVTLTTMLHRTSTGIGAAVKSVRLAEEAEIGLLLHERAKDPLVKRSIEGELFDDLAQAGQFVTTDEEARILADAETRVDAYFTASRASRDPLEQAARHEEAYAALEELVAVNLAQAEAAQRDAAWWDGLANVLGIGIGTLLVLLTGALLLWLRVGAFEPLLGLAATMERFGRGDRDARATESGPRELRDMCGRFNEMASAIAAQHRAQMAFLGGVAHDLRNPLSALQLAVSLLRLNDAFLVDHDTRRAIERIDRQIIHMERMLGDFLDIAKIEAGQLELRIGVHDARRLVEGAVDLFDANTQEHRLDVLVPTTVVPIHCDHLRIEQVITNLVSNAIKYSPTGSTIEVVLRAGEGEIELRVADHGVGISAEDLARVFEPFRRVGLSKEVVPGVGLGLFVVRRLVEAHGGRIEVESAPGEGSTFRVFLPRSARGSDCPHVAYSPPSSACT